MNTRLQVEHPVTELVTGTDLVRAQLMVAMGQPLPWRQADLEQRGHAIECRVYAEDPASGFLPQAGPLLLYREPDGPGIRIDSGVEEGTDVPVQYDPMLAKVIAHGETRDAAAARAVAALRRFPILGVRTNVAFLIRTLEHAAFRAGDLHTGFVEEHAPALLDAPSPSDLVLAAAAFARRADSVGGSPGGRRPQQSTGGRRPQQSTGGRRPQQLIEDPWSRLTDWGR
jgi:acetyl/propionyl-CoA carboxylase alpha subunit